MDANIAAQGTYKCQLTRGSALDRQRNGAAHISLETQGGAAISPASSSTRNWQEEQSEKGRAITKNHLRATDGANRCGRLCTARHNPCAAPRRAALRPSQPPPTSSSRVPGGRPNAAGRVNTHAGCQLCGVGVQHNHEQAASDSPGAARPPPPRHAAGRHHPAPPLPPPPPPAPVTAGCCCCCLLRFQFIPMYTVMAPAVSTMPATCRGWENGAGWGDAGGVHLLLSR